MSIHANTAINRQGLALQGMESDKAMGMGLNMNLNNMNTMNTNGTDAKRGPWAGGPQQQQQHQPGGGFGAQGPSAPGAGGGGDQSSSSAASTPSNILPTMDQQGQGEGANKGPVGPNQPFAGLMDSSKPSLPRWLDLN